MRSHPADPTYQVDTPLPCGRVHAFGEAGRGRGRSASWRAEGMRTGSAALARSFTGSCSYLVRSKEPPAPVRNAVHSGRMERMVGMFARSGRLSKLIY